MREYEVTYILDPALPDEEISGLMARFVELAKSGGAQVNDPERWDRRRLAYPIKDKREGIYVFMTLKAEKEAVAELVRVLKLTEPVLRHMVLRLGED